jgi:hypothetical protein
MRSIGTGVAAVIGLAALSYAALAAFQTNAKPVAAPAAVSRLSPQDIAARDRMAQLVAEVAARTAAQTAKEVVLSRTRPQQVAAATLAQKSASR